MLYKINFQIVNFQIANIHNNLVYQMSIKQYFNNKNQQNN